MGLRLLAPFSAQETNRAYYMLQERGSVVGFKRKPGDEVMVHIRRYKLSGKHLEPIAPHKALALTLTLTLTLTLALALTLTLTLALTLT